MTSKKVFFESSMLFHGQVQFRRPEGRELEAKKSRVATPTGSGRLLFPESRNKLRVCVRQC